MEGPGVVIPGPLSVPSFIRGPFESTRLAAPALLESPWHRQKKSVQRGEALDLNFGVDCDRSSTGPTQELCRRYTRLTGTDERTLEQTYVFLISSQKVVASC